MDIGSDTTPLQWELPVSDLGTPTVLKTIGEAASFLQAAFEVSKRDVVWQHAYKSLETAARDPSQVMHATKATQELLTGVKLLAD